MKTYATLILGCKVNDYEARSFKEAMDKDYQEVDFKEKADIYVIFSCCVTNTAEAKTRKFIHQARRNQPDAYIVAVGCYAQTKSDETVFETVDLVVGSKYKNRLKDFIDQRVRGKIIEDLSDAAFEELYIHKYKDRTRAFLKIQDGCNQYCSYCIIPYARGHERSLSHNKVIATAKQLAENSKEIVLTGIHTGRYNDGEYNLERLLNDLLAIDNLYHIRLSSIEITEVTDGIIDLLHNKCKLAPHLHIPVQSLSNKILKEMNRPYTAEEYIAKIEQIRTAVPNIAISTDLIVGFPSESEDDFMQTLTNLKKIGFSFVHVFPYSRKQGTKADMMTGHIDEQSKKQRVKKVIETQKEITDNLAKQFIESEVRVLVETNDKGYSYGHSDQYWPVKIEGMLPSQTVATVRIKTVGDGILIGEAIDELK